MLACLLVYWSAAAYGYQVLLPTQGTVWTTTGFNTLSWDRVVTDSLTFSAVLVNEVSPAQYQQAHCGLTGAEEPHDPAYQQSHAGTVSRWYKRRRTDCSPS